MATIRANQMEVSDRLGMLGFSIQTHPDRYFEVAVATDPALFRQKEQRTTRNFYSTRGLGPLVAERGEAVFILPPEVLPRFAGQTRLYYGLVTFADAARSQPQLARVPDADSPWVSLRTFTGRFPRRTMALRSSRTRLEGGQYGTASQDEMEWSGDSAQPGMEAVAPGPPAQPPAHSKPAATPAVPVPPPGSTQASAGFAYDDGLGALPLEVETDDEQGIEEPIPDLQALAEGQVWASVLTDAPDYSGATEFIEARHFRRERTRAINRVVIHITDGATGRARDTARYFQDPMRWLAVDVENGQPQIEMESGQCRRFRHTVRGRARWYDCANGRTRQRGGRTEGLARVPVSAHYVVGQDGTVLQMVRNNDVAYHAGSANGDSIGIEHNANPRGLNPSEAQYRASAALVRWLCEQYSIPADRQHIVGHADADPGTTHNCPGPVWDWNQYMQFVTSGGGATAQTSSALGNDAPGVYWNDVELVPQMTGMSCWAASAAMVVGWRDRICIDPAQIASGAGEWAAYTRGLNPNNRDELAAAWGLQTEAPQCYTVDGFRQLLERNGPLWVGVALPSGHAVVVTGLYGDGTPSGSFLRYHDPWPPKQGRRDQVKTFAQFMAEYENRMTTDEAGNVNVQILHAGGVGERQGSSTAQGLAADARRRPIGRPLAGPLVVPIASVIAGAAMNRIVSNQGDITWELDQLNGLKHPHDDASQAGPSAYQTTTTLIRGPQIENLATDQISADFEIRWQHNGHSLGNAVISNTNTNDAVGWGLEVKATISDDANVYGDRAAFNVRFYYRFTRALGSDHIGIFDLRLYADGQVDQNFRWTQSSSLGLEDGLERQPKEQAVEAPTLPPPPPPRARALNAAEEAVAIGGVLLDRIVHNQGNITWELDQFRGNKHPNDTPPSPTAPLKDAPTIRLEDWPKVGPPTNEISAQFAVDWQFSGRSLGNIRVANVGMNDAGPWRLAVQARILDDTVLYAPNECAALRVMFRYVFAPVSGANVVGVTELRLYGDGTYARESRWEQAGAPAGS